MYGAYRVEFTVLNDNSKTTAPVFNAMRRLAARLSPLREVGGHHRGHCNTQRVGGMMRLLAALLVFVAWAWCALTAYQAIVSPVAAILAAFAILSHGLERAILWADGDYLV